jgi:hypothetical protein
MRRADRRALRARVCGRGPSIPGKGGRRCGPRRHHGSYERERERSVAVLCGFAHARDELATQEHLGHRAPAVSPGWSESSRLRQARGAIPLPFGRSARRTTDRRPERAHNGDRDRSSVRGVSAAGFVSSTRRSHARSVRTQRGMRVRREPTPTQTSSAGASGGRSPELRSNRRHGRGTRPPQGAQDHRRHTAGPDSRLSAAAVPAAAHSVGVAAVEARSCGNVPQLLATTRRATSPRRRRYPPPVR